MDIEVVRSAPGLERESLSSPDGIVHRFVPLAELRKMLRVVAATKLIGLFLVPRPLGRRGRRGPAVIEG